MMVRARVVSGGTEEDQAMSVILSFAIFCAAAAQNNAARAVKSADTPLEGASAPARTGRDLERAAHAALRRWAQPARNDLQVAGREYLSLYKDLQHDTAMAKSARQELLGKFRFRLAALAQKLRKQAAAGRTGKGGTGKGDSPHLCEAPSGPFRQMGTVPFSTPDSVDPGSKGAPLGQQGGPAGGGSGGAGGIGPGAARDAGAELADLIESTISPSTWGRNGGLGDIYYWRPGMALVVAAPQGVHEDVGRLVDQMH
jgi:hypothetical protein